MLKIPPSRLKSVLVGNRQVDASHLAVCTTRDACARSRVVIDVAVILIEAVAEAGNDVRDLDLVHVHRTTEVADTKPVIARLQDNTQSRRFRRFRGQVRVTEREHLNLRVVGREARVRQDGNAAANRCTLGDRHAGNVR